MRIKYRHTLLGMLAMFMLLPMSANAQSLAANTDVLWDVAMSPNIGLEMTVADQSTLQVNAITSQKPYGQDVRFTAVQPEYRYYFSGRPMYKHFVGVCAMGATYKTTIADKTYNGSGVGAGLTFGYVLPVTKRLNVDFHAGVVYAKYRQKEYFLNEEHAVNHAGYEEANANGSYIMPARIGISLSYILK